MKKKENDSIDIRNELFARYPALEACRESIDAAYEALSGCYQRGGKLLVAGNGGSAADSEHIVAELMKSFLFRRKIDPALEINMAELYGDDGRKLAEKLEGALPVIPLTSMPALTSAFSNDVDPVVSFAQMIYGYGRAEDVFLGITTSGNSKNILNAFMIAKGKGMTTVGLTGRDGGKCVDLCDIVIRVPEDETFKIQELHLPIYHSLSAMLEAAFFEEK